MNEEWIIASYLMKQLLAQQGEVAGLREKIVALEAQVVSEHESSMFWYRKAAEQEKALEKLALGEPCARD